MTKTIRELLVNEIEKSFAPQSPVYVATSGGVDSSALVLAVKDAGMKPIVTSFTLDDRESQDFQAARKLAQHFSLDFVPIHIPTDTGIIRQEVIRNMRKYSLKKKADIECMYPFIYMIERLHDIGARYLLSGIWADGHFCLSKSGMIHARHSKETFQQFRKAYFYGKEKWQKTILPIVCHQYGLRFCAPFWSTSIYDLFSNATWDELNKPRQKQAIRSAFPELTPLKIKNHTNLQLGDSGIAETVGETMRQEFTPNALSPVSAYNYIWNNLKSLSK
jgi:asparagine synthetase B (glutamine-hydrolysing)